MQSILFSQRRASILKQIGSDAIWIFPGATSKIRNSDVHYPFRQCSDFYYLTGFAEPDAMMVLIPGRSQGEYVLFNQPADENKARWEGALAGQKGACEQYGADQSFAIDEFAKILPELMVARKTIYLPFSSLNSTWMQEVLAGMQVLQKSKLKRSLTPTQIQNAEALLAKMRVIKTPEEINYMQQAAKITVEAHRMAMQQCKLFSNEREVAALIQAHFSKNEAAESYPAIVAGGENACVLHYIRNCDSLRNGQLLLIDAGAEYQYYAADVTRTFPISGRYSPEQAALYEIVLNAQKNAISKVQVGQDFEKLQQQTIKIITEGLMELKILTGNLTDLIESRAYHPFYMHSLGHWLGMDVHDVGEYYDASQRSLGFQENMVLTIEPGIYIPAQSPGVDAKWWGIGIRVEDDVRVTAKGPQVLTAALEKEIADIEAIMK